MITKASGNVRLEVIGVLTVHLGLLSREQLLLEEEESHGCWCLVGSLCNWSRCFLQCGSLIWTFPKFVSGDRVDLNSPESEKRAPPRYVLEYLRCYEQWQGEADVRAMHFNTRKSHDAEERENEKASPGKSALLLRSKRPPV
jgi:hypothetical protein